MNGSRFRPPAPRIVTCRCTSYFNANARWYAARDPGEWGEPMGEGATEYEARADLVEQEKHEAAST